MEIQIEQLDQAKIATVTFSKREVDEELDRIALRIKPQVAPKGFRKNTAPLDVIKKLYHKVILAEASTKLVLEGSQEVLRKPELKNSVNPQLLVEYRPTEARPYAGDFQFNGSFLFAIRVELPPSLEVQAYRGIELDAVPPTFDYWVAKQLAAEQVNYGTKVPVVRAATPGDYLTIDFTSYVNREPLENGAEVDFQLLLGGKTFPAEFEDPLVGKTSGEFLEIQCDFPEAYSNPVFVGKRVNFNITLKEVLEVQPHPADDQLAGFLGFDSLAALREYQHDTWEQEFEGPARAQVYNALLDQLLVSNPFAVPEVWVDAEYQNVLHRLNMRQAPTDPAVISSIRELAIRSVKSAYLLDKIYETEKSCNLTAEEFKSLLEKEAKRQNLDTDEFLEQVRKRNQYEGLVSFYEHSKAVDFLIENAKYRK